MLAGEVAGKLDDMDEVLTGAAGETDTGPVVDEEEEGDTPDAVSVVDDMPHADDSEDTPDDLDSDDTPDDLDFGDTAGHGDGDRDSGGSDHLDEILTGVTNDLRLDSDVPEDVDNDDGEDSDDSDDSDEH